MGGCGVCRGGVFGGGVPTDFRPVGQGADSDKYRASRVTGGVAGDRGGGCDEFRRVHFHAAGVAESVLGCGNEPAAHPGESAGPRLPDCAGRRADADLGGHVSCRRAHGASHPGCGRFAGKRYRLPACGVG